jgi:hypothetical protein
MSGRPPKPFDKYTLPLNGLDSIFELLKTKGYKIIGLTIRDGAIVYDELASSQDLPRGWTDSQNDGSYRLQKRGDDSLFGYSLGPHSRKKFLSSAARPLRGAEREARFVAFLPENQAETATDILRRLPNGEQSAAIGKVGKETPGYVIMKSKTGASRIVNMLSGEQLPRIC